MIAVLDYGIGNLRSAEKALQHVGADASLTDEPDLARSASGLVLPGVGAFGPCALALRESGLAEVFLQAAANGVPCLAVCVGLQLLFQTSEESPRVPGLGLLPGAVRLLPSSVRRPHMQWNLVVPAPEAVTTPSLLLSEPEWYYFAHSYAVHCDPVCAAAVIASCDYGGAVTAAINHGSVVGTQFHPEKSGKAGLRLLARFAESCGELR